ncbi:hypothetical protein F0145_17400 [Adhaeribacter rhizoryzae]|uniref:Uncharacterized protein n=1 Tax=Adhaeribacter rhizoryzae TaxID=2607907 RepID=A0A5M6DAA9_9BACT|nr:DUF5990 family protein [Adhaeribacter rhizoryzae]KAA5542919.1 hypothetical protein F0145_17400 [Adhaeribacter rhizoryzae]
MSKEIKLRIVLQNLVEGVMYGLQKGKGADYDTEQAQLGKRTDSTFDFAIQVTQANGQGVPLRGHLSKAWPGIALFTLTLAAMPDKLEHPGAAA